MNVFLTGMPGCGKSTIARALAEAAGLTALDLDEEIEKTAGRTISRIFEEDGEAVFRDMETDAVQAAAAGDGRVVATGGGSVLRPQNVAAMKTSGVVVFIDRPLENILSDIETGHRPLLKDGKQRLADLYTARIGVYRASADHIVDGAGSVEDVIRKIRDALGL